MIEISKYDCVFKIRENTSDEFVVREVMSGEYRKLDITPNDIIVDFGLNIGIFTIYALKRGAKKVHSYEPDNENFSLAQYNIQKNGYKDKVLLHNLAVIGNDDKERTFALNGKKNKGAHSLLTKRGRSHKVVDCVNINTVLKTVQPTIIKMDVEGAEYECIKAVDSFAGIKQFIFEFHHAHLNDIKTHEKYNEILNLLRTKFEKVEARKDTKGAWVNVVYCVNAL